MSEEVDAPWHEYWEFLNSYYNLKTPDGLLKLENYLMQKKFEILLNNQINMCNRVKETLNLNDKSELLNKLNELLNHIDQLKEYLELKPNCLSKKFEQTQLIKSKFNDYYNQQKQILIETLTKTTTTPTTTSIQSSTIKAIAYNDDYSSFIEQIENECCLKNLSNLLNKYLSLINEVLSADYSSITYFYVYKSSKQIIKILNYGYFLQDAYLNNFFQKLNVMNNLKQDQLICSFQATSNGHPNDLIDSIKKIRVKNNDENIDFICKKLTKLNLVTDNNNNNGHDEEDEDDSFLNRLNSDKFDFKDKKNDQEDSFIDQDDNFDKDEVLNNDKSKDIFKDRFNMCKFVQKLSKFKIKNINDQRVFIYGLVRFDMKICCFLIFKPFFLIFILSDCPSKFDRAVYFAIKDVFIDGKIYPSLYEWVIFMKAREFEDMKK